MQVAETFSRQRAALVTMAAAAACAGGMLASSKSSAQLAALDPSRAMEATATLEPVGEGMARGEAVFTATDAGLEIVVTMMGLEPGRHGIHVHEQGDCEGPADSVAGDHFNPDDTPHGPPDADADSKHAGDLGNLMADSSGRARLEITSDALTIADANGVVGRAIIVHQGADDTRSQPSGESGDAAACGVIEDA